MKKIFLILTFILLSYPCQASNELKKEALSPQWLALGHYRPKIFGGYHGSIDTDSFYLAEEGRDNPQKELEATIDLFEKGVDKKNICIFQARYKYLLNKGLVKQTHVKCEKYKQFIKDLQPQGVTLLFTDAYMNNPSSLFGHTLLRIDTARQGTQLLAHGANYGAFTDGKENGALYALYGLTGGYYGGWTVKPYYDIINTYNNIENRDIWELNLDFSSQELDMFVAHLWEMGHSQTRYYFFTKNCSYMIMEALDAVRPSLAMADEFPLQTIPLDTLKAVYHRDGLVKSVNYRPSRQAKIIHRAKQMNKKQKKAFLQAIKKSDYELAGVKDEEKSDVLETAYQYVQYQFIKKDFALEEYRKRSFASLKARSKLISQEARMSENPEGKSPLKSHESMRMTIGAGHKDGEYFQEIAYRPAYHSLTDNNYGLLSGAEINFLNFKVRHYDRSDKTVLQALNILGIKSLSPIDEMFQPMSFNINLDIEREKNASNNKQGYVLNGKVGGGGTFRPCENISFYGLSNLYGSYGGGVPNNQYIGLGAALGVLVDYQYVKLLAEAEKVFASNNYGAKNRYKAEMNFVLSQNWGLATEYQYTDHKVGDSEEEIILSFRHYF